MMPHRFIGRPPGPAMQGCNCKHLRQVQAASASWVFAPLTKLGHIIPIPYDVRSEETFHSELKHVRNEIEIRRGSDLKDCTVTMIKESHLFLSATAILLFPILLQLEYNIQ